MATISLESYPNERIESVRLPEQIQQTENLVVSFEIKDVGTQLEITAATYEELTRNPNEPTEICIVGSNGMYLLFEELGEEGDRLQVLEQRCGRGKNDIDIGLLPEQARRGDKIWEFNNWIQNDDKDSGGHGNLTVNKKNIVVDLLARPQLKGFEWIDVIYREHSLRTMTPEEMIFEKLSLLAISDNAGIPVKLGIDVKLLKYYLRMKLGFDSDNRLDEYLSSRWEEYQDSLNEYNAQSSLNEKESGESYPQFVSRTLNIPTEQVPNHLSKSMNRTMEEIQQLLKSGSDEEFVLMYVEFSKKDQKRLTYDQISEQATNNFARAVENLD